MNALHNIGHQSTSSIAQRYSQFQIILWHQEEEEEEIQFEDFFQEMLHCIEKFYSSGRIRESVEISTEIFLAYISTSFQFITGYCKSNVTFLEKE